jgi:hypothetical protein
MITAFNIRNNYIFIDKVTVVPAHSPSGFPKAISSIIAEYFETKAIKPTETIRRANPHKSLLILRDGITAVV